MHLRGDLLSNEAPFSQYMLNIAALLLTYFHWMCTDISQKNRFFFFAEIKRNFHNNLNSLTIALIFFSLFFFIFPFVCTQKASKFEIIVIRHIEIWAY